MIKTEVRRPLILEGPDGSGKSTLAYHLAVAWGWEVVHGGGPPKSLMEGTRRLTQVLPCKIYDRYMGISEEIYGTVLKSKTMMPIPFMRALTKEIDPVIIVCLPSDRHLIETVQGKEFAKDKEYKANIKDQVVINQKTIINMYWNFFNRKDGLRKSIYNFEKQDFDVMLKAIEYWLCAD